MEPIKIPLSVPVEFGSEKINELVITRPMTAGDMAEVPVLQLDQLTVRETLSVIGKLCAQPPSVMNKISPKDLPALAGVFASFF